MVYLSTYLSVSWKEVDDNKIVVKFYYVFMEFKQILVSLAVKVQKIRKQFSA